MQIQLVFARAVQKIAPQDALDRNLFGPVYHGTDEKSRQAIEREGFKIFEGQGRTGALRNGYTTDPDAHAYGVVPPVHHLGFGIYFTTSKNAAKTYAGGSVRGMKTYYLDVPRLTTINFGSPHKMVAWWEANGFDTTLAATDQVQATKRLTTALKAKWDAVWFKGKGGLGRSLLDGDQIVVYDPLRIYEIDDSLALPFTVGAKVRRKSDGMVGTIINRRTRTRQDVLDNVARLSAMLEEPGRTAQQLEKLQGLVQEGTVLLATPNAIYDFFEIRWNKGGTDLNVTWTDIEDAPT